MKIKTENPVPQFKPVTITLDSLDELVFFL